MHLADLNPVQFVFKRRIAPSALPALQAQGSGFPLPGVGKLGSSLTSPPLSADPLSHPHPSRPILSHIPTPSRPILAHIPTGHEECRRCPVMSPGWTFCRSHVHSDRANSNSGGKPQLAPRSTGKLPLMQSISRAWTTSHGASMPVDFGFCVTTDGLSDSNMSRTP